MKEKDLRDIIAVLLSIITAEALAAGIPEAEVTPRILKDIREKLESLRFIAGSPLAKELDDAYKEIIQKILTKEKEPG